MQEEIDKAGNNRFFLQINKSEIEVLIDREDELKLFDYLKTSKNLNLIIKSFNSCFKGFFDSELE